MPTILPATPAVAALAPAATLPFSTVLATAARQALQWRLLLLWALLLLLPTLAATLPIWQMLGDSLDHSTKAPALAQALDLATVADLRQVFKRYDTAAGNGALVALMLTLLLSPLLSGMTISAARAPVRLSLRELLGGGMLEYGRLLRMLLWSSVPFALAFVLGNLAAAPIQKLGDRALLETTVQNVNLASTLVLGLFLLLAHASVDAGRAVLAADRRKTSAVRAWGEGVKLLVRRPLIMLGAYGAVTLLGLALAGIVALVRIRVAPIEGWSFFAALGLTQLAVMAVAWMRAARLFSFIALVRGQA